MKPKLTPSILDTLARRIAGRLSVAKNRTITLTSRSNKAQSFGREETHAVQTIHLKRSDRVILKAMASRYRIDQLERFVEGILAGLDERGDGTQVLFRVYE